MNKISFTISSDWWKFIFNEDYLKTYVDIITNQRTEKEVRFILKFIRENFKNKKIKILDLACGYGRHSILLAKKGYFITGIDYSDFFLKLAREEVGKFNLKNVEFLKQDIRKIKFKNEFDLVISMFTSFGYFDDESDNFLVLKNVYQSLRKGGFFILDLENYLRWFDLFLSNGKLIKNFIYYTITKKQSNNLKVKTEFLLDYYKMRIIIRRSWSEDKEKKSYEGSFRIYSLGEILFYLRLLNFEVKKIYGGFNNEKFTPFSSRMIIIASKNNYFKNGR